MVDAQRKRIANLHLGTMGWSYDFWNGSFYPEDLSSKEYLNFYSKNYNSVEVDSTFYRIPRIQTIKDWWQQTPDDFLFSMKFPRKITHFKMLKDAEDDTKVFLERAKILEDKLGVLLIQLPPSFKESNLQVLKDYISGLPTDNRYAVEVRNKTLLTEELFSFLTDHRVALSWVDSEKMPLKEELTSDFVYLRWEGSRREVKGDLGQSELDREVDFKSWARIIDRLIYKKIEIFGYFSKYYSGFPPGDIDKIISLL